MLSAQRSAIRSIIRSALRGDAEGGSAPCSGSKGVVFSGSEGIYAPNSVLTEPPLTMVCWATVPPSQTVAMSLAEEDVTGGEQFLNLFVTPTRVEAYVRETAYASSNSNHGASVGDLIHCAAVYNSSSSRIAYANGVAGPENTVAQNVLGIDTIAVGHQRYALQYRYYDGTLYHAAWYNRALTPTEIAELAAGANPRNYSGLVRYLPLAGASTAGNELIEPSTWTTVGTLEDGDCATTVTGAYVPPALPQVASSDYLGDRSMWATRFANTLYEFNPEWNTAYGDETDGWTESDEATDFMLDTLRDAGYDTVFLNVDYGNGTHYYDPNNVWYQRRDYQTLRGKDPLKYFCEQASLRGMKVVADIFSMRTFEPVSHPAALDPYINEWAPDQKFYDPTNSTFRALWVARVLDLIERYDIYEVMLDYHRTGQDNAGTAVARRDDLTAMIQGVKDGLAGVGKPNMRISAWGHNSTGRLHQGNWCAWWVDNGYIDRQVDGNYGFYPIDNATMDMQQVDFVTGMDTYSVIAGAIPDLAAADKLDKFQIGHSAHYRENFGGGGLEYTFMSEPDWLLMANQARLASPNTGINSYLFNFHDKDLLASAQEKLFNNDNVTLETQNLTKGTHGKAYVRRYPVSNRTVTNLMRTPAIANSEDLSGAGGSATYEGNGVFSSSAINHNVALFGSLLGAYGAATLRFRAKITTTIANQIVRLQLDDGTTVANYDKTFATPGTYVICSGAYSFAGTGSLNIYLYPHRAAAAAEIGYSEVCLTDGTDPQEYVYTVMGDNSSETFESATDAAIIDDTADLKVLRNGTLITDNTVFGMRTSPLSRSQIEVETIVKVDFNDTDDKGNNIIVQAGQSASDDYWEVRFNRTTANVQIAAEKAGGGLTVYSRTPSYVAGDRLRIRSVLSEANGVTLEVENLTQGTAAVSSTWTGGEANQPFRNQMMTFVGSRLGYNNGNQSDYTLESISQGSVGSEPSIGVTFSGTEAIYAPNTVLTEPPFTMVCWATVPSSTSQQATCAMVDNTASDDYEYLRVYTTDVRGEVGADSVYGVALSPAHGKSAGELVHAAYVCNSSTSRFVYADGVAGAEYTTPRNSPAIDTFAVGVTPFSGVSLRRYFNGTIYHAAWYNRALSPTEIAELAAGADPQDYAGLVRYLPLNGAANAAEELVEPSTWTVEGTLADGPGDETVTS